MIDRFFTPAASALILIIFLLFSTLTQPLLASWRTDLTEETLYTLSDGTSSTLHDLIEPVDLTFVYTRRVGQDYPAVRAYAQRVRELLQAYQNQSGRRLRVREIDPTPFSTEEDQALAAGITAVQTNGTDPLYFGLIGRNTVDDERVIPFLSPEREATLEYDLTRLIARLDKPEPATIGIITDLPNMKGTGEDGGYFVLREIAALYNVLPIPSDFTAIPGEVDALLLAHAANLSNRQLYLIDQFVLERGRALALIDPASTIAQAGQVFSTGNERSRSDLGVLGDAWGITLSDGVVADIEHAMKINRTENSRLVEVDQPIFISLPRNFLSADDLTTAPLSLPINLGAPGALSPTDTGNVTFRPLMQTGRAPSYIPAANINQRTDPADVLQAYSAEDEPFTIAARISGQLSSAFPSGPPPPDRNDPVEAGLNEIAGDAAGPHRAVSQTPADIIIIADTDMLDDAFYLDPRSDTARGDNATLILNAIDNLTGGSELANLRSRTPNLRLMTRVNAMRDAAQDEFFSEQAALEARLSESQGRLEELQSVGATGGFFSGDIEADLTPDERLELTELRQSVVDTRESLRGIERDFRRDIDALEDMLRLINIWGGPLIVFLIGLLVWYRKRRRAG